jgi:hypothetical protein
MSYFTKNLARYAELHPLADAGQGIAGIPEQSK